MQRKALIHFFRESLGNAYQYTTNIKQSEISNKKELLYVFCI